MTSIDLAARDAPAATEDVALRLQRCCRAKAPMLCFFNELKRELKG
jgi:hypothetical protein